MAIEFRVEHQLKKFRSAVEQLRETLDVPESAKQQVKIYRFAVYRNFILSYYMFLSRIVFLLSLTEIEQHTLGVDEFVADATERGILSGADSDIIAKAEKIFGALKLYDYYPPDLSEDEIMAWMPEVCAFFERYLLEQTLVDQADQVKEFQA